MLKLNYYLSLEMQCKNLVLWGDYIYEKNFICRCPIVIPAVAFAGVRQYQRDRAGQGPKEGHGPIGLDAEHQPYRGLCGAKARLLQRTGA